MRNALIITCLSLMPISASAMSWERMEARGVEAYRVQAQGLRLTLVCDPNGAYDPPQQYLLFRFDAPQEHRLVRLKAAHASVNLHLIADTQLKLMADPADWAALLDIISDGSPFTLTTDDQAWQLIPANTPDHGCTS
ncbi:MAG: hypothetical protein ACXIUW_11810 [Roseinatronobacter sp.]